MPLSQNALTTLETIKDELGIADTSKDNYLIRKINAMSDFIEHELNRKLGKKTYIAEKYTGNNRQKLALNNYPIIGVSEIRVDGEVLINTDYQLQEKDKECGMIYKEDGWTWDGYLTGYVGEPTAPKRTIEVDYTAGYVLPKDETEENPRTLPYDLENLVIQLIAEEYNKRGSEGLKSFSASDVDWVWSDGLKQMHQAILAKYRRLSV